MNRRQITSWQMQAILMMFLMGSSYVMGDVSKTKQDTWITFILGAIFEIPMIFIYCAILQKYPDKNFFEIIEISLGKTAGKIICGLYAWYGVHLCSMVIRIFTEFIHILNMPETPIIVILIFMILIAILGVRCGPESMGRIAKFTFPILSTFVIFTFLIGIKDMDFKVLTPMFSTDLKTILAGSYTTFATPYSELIVCLPLFFYLKPQSNPKKIYLNGLALSVAVLLIAFLRNILILGLSNMQRYYYTSYLAVSELSIGEFFTRIEVLIGISVILAGFTKMCVLLFTASSGIAKICNIKDYRSFAAPCGLVTIILAVINFANVPDMFKWLEYHPFYTIPFHIILPVIIWIAAVIKTRKKKDGNSSNPENAGSID